MSNTTNPASGSHAVQGSHLTVEDAGSTTDAADLTRDDTTASDPGAPSAPGAPEPPQAPTGGRAALGDDIGHVFDQTNGVVEGLDGDSDGTADSDEASSAERADENPAFESFADTEVAGSADTDDSRRTGS